MHWSSSLMLGWANLKPWILVWEVSELVGPPALPHPHNQPSCLTQVAHPVLQPARGRNSSPTPLMLSWLSHSDPCHQGLLSWVLQQQKGRDSSLALMTQRPVKGEAFVLQQVMLIIQTILSIMIPKENKWPIQSMVLKACFQKDIFEEIQREGVFQSQVKLLNIAKLKVNI